MPYSLLASHCRRCRDCLRWPRQVWSPGSVGSRRPWDWWWGAQCPMCAHPGPFSHSSFRGDCSPLEPGATRGQGSFCSSQGWLTCVAQDLTLLADGMLLSLLVMSLACHSQGLALCQPTLPPCCGLGWLLHPTVLWGKEHLGIVFGEELRFACLGERLWG